LAPCSWQNLIFQRRMNVHDNTPTMVISIQTKNLVVGNCKLINCLKFHRAARIQQCKQHQDRFLCYCTKFIKFRQETYCFITENMYWFRSHSKNWHPPWYDLVHLPQGAHPIYWTGGWLVPYCPANCPFIISVHSFEKLPIFCCYAIPTSLLLVHHLFLSSQSWTSQSIGKFNSSTFDQLKQTVVIEN